MRRDRKIVIRHISTDLTPAVLRRLGYTPSTADLNEFAEWYVERQWQQFQQEKMNRITATQTQLNELDLRFPNARNGDEYCHTVTIPAGLLDDMTVEGLPESSGLRIIYGEDGQLSIQGTPLMMADYELVISGRPAGMRGTDRPVSRRIPLYVNANPWDLWKNLPVAENLPFKKPDEDCEYVRVVSFEGRPQKDIVAASKRGRSHANEGKPRDDDFSIKFLPENGWYIMVVADGAGSAKYSREGSRIAVKTVTDWCSTYLHEKGEKFEADVCQFFNEKSDAARQTLAADVQALLYDGAKDAYLAIEKCVAGCTEPAAAMRDFSTTLLAVVCRKFEFGWFVASFGVGDGAIAIYDKKADAVRLLHEPDGGEFAGQTRFLTMRSIFSDRTRIGLSIVPDFTSIMLMTDGVSDPFFETDNNLKNKACWDHLWNEISANVALTDDNESAKSQLLNWLDFRIAGNHDDRTIAILY